LKVLDNPGPFTLPDVHAAFPEQVPATVLTSNVNKSSFLIALLNSSAIKAYFPLEDI
jgi:hypothetical protein